MLKLLFLNAGDKAGFVGEYYDDNQRFGVDI